MNKIRQEMIDIKKDVMLIDIDGTFVYDSSSVSKEDLTAFQKIEKNYIVGIATGRSIEEITYVEKANNIQLDYRIGFNGALIIDQQDNILYDQPIEQTSWQQLVDYLEENQLIFDTLDGKMRLGNFKHEAQDQLLGMDYIYLEDPYKTVRPKTVYKVNIRPETLEQAKQVTQELKELFPGLSVFRVGKRRIEISAKDTSKGQALKKITSGSESTIAIGDSENDISMFEQATISYCMEHAPEYVREKATFVVPRFSDAINHLLETKEGLSL